MKNEKWYSLTLKQDGKTPIVYTTEFIDGEPYRVESIWINGKRKILSKTSCKDLQVGNQ